MNSEFEPHRLKKSKLYLDITLKSIKENYPIKYTFFEKIKQLLKKILKK